jgi:hypothetical protein
MLDEGVERLSNLGLPKLTHPRRGAWSIDQQECYFLAEVQALMVQMVGWTDQ